MAATGQTAEAATAVMWPPEGRVVLHGVSWERYEALLAALGDDYPALRMTYLEGTLEIMTTSPTHERIKKVIARLLEIWALERDVVFNGYGAATFRKREPKRGLEPDECYVLGELKDVPDLAIEVVHTHGGIDKLSVYAGLRVREVWFWEDGTFGVYALAGDVYSRNEKSVLLPALDIAELAAFVRRAVEAPDQTAVVRAYQNVLRGRG
jgi:Uma2 family endonuclease